jgi:CheY-like chemotaxis protein
MNILVVEDDSFIRDMAVTELEEAGHEVMEAASGGQALRLLQTGIAVDALLTDIRMPEANGWEVARAYRQRFPDLPVVYVTGYAEQLQPVPGGIVISKPFRMAQLVDLLNALRGEEEAPYRTQVGSGALPVPGRSVATSCVLLAERDLYQFTIDWIERSCSYQYCSTFRFRISHLKLCLN